MKKIFYLTIFLSLISCNKDSKNIVHENEIYSFINYIINTELSQKENKNKYLTECFPTPIPTDEYFGIETMNNFFDKNDVKFMKSQLDKRYHFRLKNNLIKNRITVPFDSLIKPQDKNKKSENYWENTLNDEYVNEKIDEISLPIFSKNYKTAIISFGTYGGNGQTEIYRKSNGNWKKIKTIAVWKNYKC